MISFKFISFEDQILAVYEVPISIKYYIMWDTFVNAFIQMQEVKQEQVTYYSFHTEFFCLSTKHAKILSLQVNFRNSTNLMSNIVAMLYFLGCHI